jgi:rare lipoprotein A
MQVLKHIRFHLLALLMAAFLLAGISAIGAGSRDEKDKSTRPANEDIRTGMASWYGGQFHGRKTTTGEVFDMNRLTCASNKYPLGTWLKVTNLRSGKSVVVRVNDRMHPKMRRIVDLSKGAAKQIGIINTGVATVSVENLGNLEPRGIK